MGNSYNDRTICVVAFLIGRLQPRGLEVRRKGAKQPLPVPFLVLSVHTHQR